MPYCPKCDMEFIEGITVCSDCGGLLLESKEPAVSIQKQQLEEDSWDVSNNRPYIYVTKSQKYSDLQSSTTAFLLVAGAFIIIAVLCWINIITADLFSKCILTLLGLISLYAADITNQSAKKVRGLIGEEESMTNQLTDWFLASYTGNGLDEQILREYGELGPEELSLKRLDLIQDLIITNHHIADQSYADTLAENLYEKLYED